MICGLSVGKVRRVIADALAGKKCGKLSVKQSTRKQQLKSFWIDNRAPKLTAAHIEWLLEETRFKEHVSLNLAERAAMLHRHFPEVRITP